MAMTAEVKDELARLPFGSPQARRAELVALLRVGGSIHVTGDGGGRRRLSVEVDLDSGQVARRLRAGLVEVWGAASETAVVSPGGARRSSRYLVRVTRDAESLLRGSGVVDPQGRPVRGFPHAVVTGGPTEAVALWRGAFLARGTLTEPGRSTSLEIGVPGQEVGMALAGAARRLGVGARVREVRGADRVVVKDGDAIAALLTHLGAQASRLSWEERRVRREVRASATRLANFDDANLRRSARAAVQTSARVRRALELLGDDAPEHLVQAGRLRLEHDQASLEDLGRMADPPLTKDAVAGRLRRLLGAADAVAAERGEPDTASAVPPDADLDG